MSTLPTLRTRVPFYLTTAIAEAFGPDPHLPEPDKDTVEAVALLVLVVAAVSKSRRAELANEPWKEKSALYHLDHSSNHTSWAQLAVVEPRDSAEHFDHETGLAQLGHATLRNAFALRLLVEELHL